MPKWLESLLISSVSDQYLIRGTQENGASSISHRTQTNPRLPDTIGYYDGTHFGKNNENIALRIEVSLNLFFDVQKQIKIF